MHHIRPLTLWISILSPSLWAATALPGATISHQTLTNDFSIISSQMPLKNDAIHKNSLVLISQNQDLNQHFHIRMQQYYQGVPILGGYIIIHSQLPWSQLKQNISKSFQVTGQLYQNIERDLQELPQTNAQKDLILKQYESQKFPAANILSSSIKAFIYINKDNTAHWAYEIKIKILNSDNSIHEPSVVIDAKSHQVYEKWDNLHTEIKSAKGNGYGGNDKSGKYHFGSEKPYLMIQYNDEDGSCHMENVHTSIIDAQHKPISNINKSIQFLCESTTDGSFVTGYKQDGYDQINGAFSPSNDALYTANIIYRLYHDWYHLDPLAKSDGQNSKLIMKVHVGKQYANAYWDGHSMNFGDGDEKDFYPLVSIGIGAHEISHGFTQYHSNLRYYGETGAINEAFSDMAAKAAEAFVHQPLEWSIGAEILKPSSTMKALRYMDQPHRDENSVDTIEEYHKANNLSWEKYGEGLDVHFGSGVFNRIFYLIATSPNWNIRKAFDVMLHANMHYWTPYSKFQEAGCGILEATIDKHYSTEAIYQALNTVGIKSQECHIDEKYS